MKIIVVLRRSGVDAKIKITNMAISQESQQLHCIHTFAQSRYVALCAGRLHHERCPNVPTLVHVKILFGRRFERDLFQKPKYFHFSDIIAAIPTKFVFKLKISAEFLMVTTG